MDALEKATAELVEKDFNLERIQDKPLREILAERIGDLLKNNPILLKSIFYRIDLNESLLGMALVSMEGENLHLELADQVIERMRKKAEWRVKFSQSGSDSPDGKLDS
ncbi:MAG: hypothetical protein LPK45_04450 [Bacteroidota bacterium]|nr:hypothetical protein [Bacteroidota bacterium]MDX5430305.1 hypothetical protein [Bacteroidota bacterium]MDX5469066.1 hypothetical protein [Bacteroidota bacterium]